MTPTAVIEVLGTRAGARVEAIVDTGFDGDVCLPVLVAASVGLELIGKEEIELADGTRKSELVFAGKARFLDEVRDVQVFLTESDDPLIGTRLLSGCLLTIDFLSGQVELAKAKGTRRRDRKRKRGP